MYLPNRPRTLGQNRLSFQFQLKTINIENDDFQSLLYIPLFNLTPRHYHTVFPRQK